ncbi:MAG TPA: sugar transferase [Candidatus Saccharimonadales bacterium]|nr:sugar transferase [Candidatus Saccharimonadales bacterium]
MKNNASLIYRIILVFGDFLALVAAFSVAYIIRVQYDPRPLIQQIPADTYLLAILLVLPLWIIIHGAIGLYSRTVFESRFSELGKLILGSILGILAVVGYDFVINDSLFPARLVVVYGFALGFGFLLVFRTLARKIRAILFSYNIGITNLLVVGSGKSAESVINQFVDTASTGYRIIGIVGKPSDNHPKIPAFDSLEQAKKRLRKQIHSIIQTKLYRDEDKNTEILSFAQKHHIEFRFIPTGSELYTGNIEVELFREIPAVTVHQTALIGWGRVVKRIFDLIFGSLLLLILSPVMLLTALLIKITSPRERILFRQIRLTQFNKPFTVYKFRSQSQKFDGTTPEEAFTMLGRPELARQYRDNGDYLENDPRVSSLGRFLRKASLDELPQLFNVIRGDISLVGPRALIPEELEKYHQKHHILSVKSGMTGLAQVSGRLNISFEERRKLDLYYVQNWSFWLDIVILLRTLRTVISGKGAE